MGEKKGEDRRTELAGQYELFVYADAPSVPSLTIDARMLSMDSATDTRGSDDPYTLLKTK